MATKQRWQFAQSYEQSYWRRTAELIASGAREQFGWYQWKADLMEKHLAGLLPDNRHSLKVLEVGSGPIGIVSFLNWGIRHTLDPLENFYRSNTTLTALRKPEVQYRQGTGEQVPHDPQSIDIVILDNVLDHVNEAPQVLAEIRRVLNPNGLLYLAVNVHSTWGGILHRVLSKLRIDRGHPYTFTTSSIRRFIQRHGFSVERETVNDYYEAREQDRKSNSTKDKIKGYTGLSEFVYYAVCKPSEAK